jgi:uncharacterized protein (TIGR02246 family)
MFLRCALILSQCALLLCCQQAHRAAGTTHEAEVKVLRDVEVDEEQAWISKDPEKAVSFYADDAIVMNPNTPAVSGRDQIRASMRPFFDDPGATVKYQITNVEVAQSGDLGYTVGTYVATSTDPVTRKVVVDRGKALTIRKRQPDGTWKIVQDIYHSDLPISAPGK